MTEKHKKVYRPLNYLKHFFVFISAVSDCALISAFASLLSVSTGITISAVELEIFAITVEIKKYKSIIKKRRKKHNKRVLLAKIKLNTIKVLISKASNHSYKSHDKFVLANNVIREYSEMKEENQKS